MRKKVVWASPTLAQTITVLVLVAAALCVSLIGDDYIAPTTCVFGGECGYQAYGATGAFPPSSLLCCPANSSCGPRSTKIDLPRQTCSSRSPFPFVRVRRPYRPSTYSRRYRLLSRQSRQARREQPERMGMPRSSFFLRLDQLFIPLIFRRLPSTTLSSRAPTRTSLRTSGRRLQGSA
jgi:hypothetical protein